MGRRGEPPPPEAAAVCKRKVHALRLRGNADASDRPHHVPPPARDRLRARIPASHGSVISRRWLACRPAGGLPRFACPPSFGRRENPSSERGSDPAAPSSPGRGEPHQTPSNPKNQPSAKAGQVHAQDAFIRSDRRQAYQHSGCYRLHPLSPAITSPSTSDAISRVTTCHP